MDHTRLIQIIEAYGAHPERWPEEERFAAEQLLGDDLDANRLLSIHKLVDRALDSYVVVHPLHLKSKIMANLPGRALIDRWLEWLIPDFDEIRSYFWRPVLAACLPLVTGLLLGSSLLSVDVVDSWEDEIVLIALDGDLGDE